MQTRASLIQRIRNPSDTLAWGEFVRLYAPLLHAYAMKNSLQDADAADVAQETLRNVLRAAPEFVYDPRKGSFRGWLLTIARNEIRKFATRQPQARGSGDTDINHVLAEVPGRVTDDSDWDREYRINLFHWAAGRVKQEFRPATWDAFWRSVVLEEPCEAVAGALGMSTGAVYIARSRAIARIRREIETVDGGEA